MVFGALKKGNERCINVCPFAKKVRWDVHRILDGQLYGNPQKWAGKRNKNKEVYVRLTIVEEGYEENETVSKFSLQQSCISMRLFISYPNVKCRICLARMDSYNYCKICINCVQFEILQISCSSIWELLGPGGDGPIESTPASDTHSCIGMDGYPSSVKILMFFLAGL